MFAIYDCIANAHDLRLVGLAALICAFASFAGITLLHHVVKSRGAARVAWVAISAVSTGLGIWATHFVAMLAFSPGIPSGYNIALTAASLVAAIIVTGAGLLLAIQTSPRSGPWLGGALVGGGIAAMHYIGMAAFEIMGHIVWNPGLVVVSIWLGAALGSAALAAGIRDGSLRSQICGAALLTLAICSHHFTAMGAVTIVPDPTIEISSLALPAGWLAMAVVAVSGTVILLALTGVALDLKDRRMAQELVRMRGLADAAVEGLIVCEGDTIVTVNNAFAALAGRSFSELVGTKLESYIPHAAHLKLSGAAGQPVETGLQHADGSTRPVELILQTIDFAGRMRDAIAVRDLRARKLAEQKIRFLAHHDALTGLANRSSFDKRLDQEIEMADAEDRQIALLCLDIDHFKEVNDIYGHAAGDTLLRTFSRCVSSLLRPGQMLARLGGDEFAIIMPKLSNPSGASRLAEQILEALAAEDVTSPATSLVSCSIGIAVFPYDAEDRQSLLSHADTALYRAKREGRGCYRFFEAAMGAETRDRRRIEHELRNAVAANQLSLVYQPQRNIESNAVVGFEALLRWTHPTRGIISPSIFIPIAEENGSILKIGEWVLRAACREAASWKHPLRIAVNVSAVQLHHPGFASLVHDLLLETGFKPQLLELEITETALVKDLNRALKTLRDLKTLGVRIAMDDFGTGYSSLSNLRAFPFDKIKIDRSFIKSVDSNPQTATIVRAVLGLGRALGLPVLAEGVETRAELGFLANEACNEVQGYLLGKPMPIGEFRQFTHGHASPIAKPRLVASA